MNFYTKKYNPQIYPRKLFVAVQGTNNDIESKFLDYEYDPLDIDEKIINSSHAVTVKVIEKKTHDCGVLVWIIKPLCSIEVITHESIHFVTNVFNDCNISVGYDNGEDESFAYLAGWCAKCINNTINEYWEKKYPQVT